MTEKEYYERYWQQKKLGKVAAQPPSWDEESFKRIKALIKSHIKGRVLDVGCGSGRLSFELSKLEKVKRVVGIDISPTAIAQAKKKYPRLDFKTASVTKLPFPKGSFDFLSAMEIVEHVVDVEEMFKEFNRALRKKGKLLITTVDFNFFKQVFIAAFFWEKYFHPTNPHIRFFTHSTLSQALKEAGFRVIDYQWNGDYLKIMPKGQIVIAQKQ